MSRPFLRVELSAKDADFRSLAIEPGVPMLGQSGSVGTLLKKWLGRFAAEVVWQNNTVEFYAQDDEGCRFAEIQPHLATKSDLKGKLKHEFAELKDRLKNAKPQSPSAQATHRFLCEGLLNARSGKGFADLECQFFKYLDVHGRWKLIWCCGFEPTIEDGPVVVTICQNLDCRQLSLVEGCPEQTCKRCENPFHQKAPPRRYRGRVAALLVLALAGAAGYFLYMRPWAILTGRIVRAADALPVAGAEVRIGGTPVATSDRNGAFRIKGLPRKTVEFEVSASGFRQQSFKTEAAADKESSIEIQLVGSGSLSGNVICVVGTKELPIPQARISVPSMKEATAKSDERGRFVLAGLPPGPLKLNLSADGFLPAEVDTAVSSEAGEPLQVVLVGGEKLAGRVVYAADTSVAVGDAQVGVTGSEQATARTDSSGQFELSAVPPGPLQVFASAEGFRRNTVRTESTTDSLQIPLAGDAILTGSVIRGDTNLPASGAEVFLPGTPFKTIADDEGLFRIEDVCSGSVRIEGTLAGLSALMEESLPSSRVTSVELILMGGASIQGRVVNAIDQNPIADAAITVAQTELKAKTDKDGQFTLAGLSAGEVTLQVAAENCLPQDFVRALTKGQQDLKDIVLTPVTSVNGLVVRALDEQPIENAIVTIQGRDMKGQTSQNGEFSIAGVPTGPGKIQVAASGFLSQELDEEFSPVKHQIKAITLVGDTNLGGMVVTTLKDGKKLLVPDASIEVRIGPYRSMLSSASNGGFTVGKVPSGEVQLTVRAEGYREASITKIVDPENARIEVAMIPLAFVKGVVIDAGDADKPVANATIQANVDGAERQIPSGPDGGFVVGQVQSNQIELTIRAEGYREERVSKTVDPTDAWIEVLMKPLIDLRGVVVDATDRDKPIPNASVQVSVGGVEQRVTSGQDGGFSVDQLASEQVEITAQAEGYRDTRVKKSVDPATPWAEVEMTPLIAVQGAVVEAGGQRKPVANASIRISVDGMEQQVTSAANGGFAVNIPSGEAVLSAEAPGFAKVTLRKPVSPDDSWIEIPMKPGTNVKGQVVNAVNNKPVSGVAVALDADGAEGSDYTDSEGRFEVLEMPVGPTSVAISHPDFESVTLGHDTADNSPLRVVLSPKMPDGEVRIVLTWAARPRDLDGHLYGSDSSGSRFHVSFKNPNAMGAKLDVDAKEGLGPETITAEVAPGKYQYYVAHAENIGTSDGKGLDASRAQVRVYFNGSQSKQPFTIPASAGGPVWHAIDILVDESKQITVTPANQWHQDVQAE